MKRLLCRNCYFFGGRRVALIELTDRKRICPVCCEEDESSFRVSGSVVENAVSAGREALLKCAGTPKQARNIKAEWDRIDEMMVVFAEGVSA